MKNLQNVFKEYTPVCLGGAILIIFLIWLSFNIYRQPGEIKYIEFQEKENNTNGAQQHMPVVMPGGNTLIF